MKMKRKFDFQITEDEKHDAAVEAAFREAKRKARLEAELENLAGLAERWLRREKLAKTKLRKIRQKIAYRLKALYPNETP